MYSSTNKNIRVRAAKAILGRAEEVPLDLLIDILEELSHEGLGANVQSALILRKDSELVSKMIELLKSNDNFVREVACSVLGHSGKKQATPYLLQMVDDPHLMVRRAAGFGLAFLKDNSALEEVKKLYQRHQGDNINVVMALQCALDSLSKDN